MNGFRDEQFLLQILHDVHQFQGHHSNERVVLIFPPQIAPRFRFLLHQSVRQNFASQYKAISVGPANQRRTFLYDMSLVKASEIHEKLQKNDDEAAGAASASSPVSKSARAKTSTKRPNKKLYQPPQAAVATSSRSKSPATPDQETCAESPAAAAVGEDADEGTWESLYDDAGDCIDPDLIKEFKNALSLSDEEELKFDNVTGDYSGFAVNESKFDLTDNEYAHVLEVHSFSDSLKTPDIFSRIASVGSTDFDVVWVDDTHALLVFGSQIAANSVLHCAFPDLKVRVLSQATRESKLKAKNCTDRLLPFKKRPQTSLDAARRLVGRHLGLKVQVSQSQLQAERKVLQEAKDRRRLNRKQTNDVWEGNVN